MLPHKRNIPRRGAKAEQFLRKGRRKNAKCRKGGITAVAMADRQASSWPRKRKAQVYTNLHRFCEPNAAWCSFCSKSISGEETFLHDTEARKVLRACPREQPQDISGPLKRRRLGAHTIQVKVRYGDFTTLTRQITVEEPLTEAGDIYRLGCSLLGRERLVSCPLRLLGLGVASLREPAGQQLVLL